MDRVSVAVPCKSLEKFAKVTRRCDGYSATQSTTAFLALLAKWKDSKNCCELLTI